MRNMVKRLASAAALCSVTSVAYAQCQDMSVFVRDSVYNIHGLNEFCTEFEKLKSDVHTLMQRLAKAERENEALRVALRARSAPKDGQKLVSSR